MAKKLKPKRTDMSYLRGWFLVQAKGDHKQAKRLAEEYRNKLL